MFFFACFFFFFNFLAGDGGIMQALIEVIQDTNKYITTRATILIGELLELCNRLLPTSYGTKIQVCSSIPCIFFLFFYFLSFYDTRKIRIKIFPQIPINVTDGICIHVFFSVATQFV